MPPITELEGESDHVW